MEDYPSLREHFLQTYPDLHQKLVLNDELKRLMNNYDSNVWPTIQVSFREELIKLYVYVLVLFGKFTKAHLH